MSTTSDQPDSALQTPAKRKGPWANRVVTSEVEHTPEYDAFMEKLAEYHKNRGTTLVHEPELGRKLLDLHKLYATVTSQGGYDIVTEKKGAWRDIANTYKPPINNSNAGYLLKTIYYKYLAAYEITNFFHKDPPPKEWLEDRSAAGGAIMTRTAADFMAAAGSPKPEANGISQSPPPMTEKRSLRAQPTPRQRFAPDTTPQRATNVRSQSHPQQQQQHPQQQHTPQQQQQQQHLHQQNVHPQQAHHHQQQPHHLQHHQQPHHHQQQHHYQQPVANGVTHVSNGGNASLFPDFRPSQLTLPEMRPVLTPRTAPESYAVRRRRFPEVNGGPIPVGPRLGAGHLGCSLMHRITMSLKTELESDVEHSMKSLVRVSFEAGDEFLAVHWPSLCDLLFDIIREELQYVKDNVTDDRVDDAVFLKRLERLNDACLVVRNMTLQVDNARRFATVNTPKDILVEGLTLPSHASLAEVKSYFLDMAEVMAGFLPFSANDPLLEVLTHGLESSDRGTMLGAMRAMCRFIMSRDDYNNRMADIPTMSIHRITSILMLEDEELVSACLDFLYQYTLHEDNIKALLDLPEGYELVRHLVRLLLFQGITGEQLVYIKMVKKGQPPSYDIPHLPDEIVRELLAFAEPERATQWMRCCFEEDPEADITQIALWQAYQSRFNEYVSAGYPLLPAAEFIKNVSVAFQTASAMVLPTAQGQRFIIKGIRARETPMSTKGLVHLACKWFSTPGNAVSRCTAQLPTLRDLWAHILAAHLPPATEDNAAPIYSCKWAGCSRFGPHGELDRRKVVAHIRTHMPDDKKRPVASKEEIEMMEDPDARVIIRRCQTVIDERGEPCGIPLTSVLVLRNIRKRGGFKAKLLIDGWKNELAEVMAVNKPLAIFVGDLVVGGLGGPE